MERKSILPRFSCYECKLITQSSIQRCFISKWSITDLFHCYQREISPQMKQGNCCIESSMSQSTLTKEKILEVYADIFNSLGTFPGEPYKFRLKENYVSSRYAPRKVLINLQDVFHAEIHDLVKQGVLERVEHSTEWVNSFIIVEKDVSIDSGNIETQNHKFKKLRICLDPRDLNKAFKCKPYYSQLVDELIAKFHGCKVFLIIDMKKVYWMAPLNPDSRPSNVCHLI